MTESRRFLPMHTFVHIDKVDQLRFTQIHTETVTESCDFLVVYEDSYRFKRIRKLSHTCRSIKIHVDSDRVIQISWFTKKSYRFTQIRTDEHRFVQIDKDPFRFTDWYKLTHSYKDTMQVRIVCHILLLLSSLILIQWSGKTS